MKITLTNDFHNSEVCINVKNDGYVSPGQIKKIQKTLCGISGCTCSGDLGTRGKQEVDINLHYKDDGQIICGTIQNNS